MKLRLVAIIAFASVLGLGATCRVHPPDELGTGDEHFDDATRADAAKPDAGSECKSDKGNIVLLDARTAAPLTCTLVTVAREPEGCPSGYCSSIPLYQGLTNTSGQVNVSADLAHARISAVSEGYALSYRDPAPVSGVAEIEMQPANVFWIKFLDGEGNYLSKLQVTFKQGDDVVATMHTNELANVFFNTRTLFNGQPVLVEAEGYPAVTINGAEDLGTDGHTLTLKKK
jgi:hypothetical protein